MTDTGHAKGTRMSTHDEQTVERMTAAFEMHWRSSGPKGETFTEAVRNGMRAAIEAMGEAEPPLEDVLGMGYWVSITTKRSDGSWIAVVADHDTGIKTEATGPTIDEAIRAAVANAKGGAS